MTDDKEEARRTSKAAWRAANREKLATQDATYRAANREKKAASDAARRRANPEKSREKNRAYAATWRRANPGKRRAGQAAWCLANREECATQYAVWYVANREKKAAYNAAWCRANPERAQAKTARRRALKHGTLISDMNASQWTAIKTAFAHRCVYCGKKPERLTQDHVIPLSKGGNHTASNIVPACQPCNARKHTGLPLVPIQTMLGL